ncbi:hypothetical protein PAAG_05492 [Paracoccidioides lutzii Pb01]|uniref:Uncharacterized protein n=1 Tax=Paracoccidioides lutzii (strain ATCC MYA-826 / Pb01) TaxID=502779 RepID=C1H3Z9_PARBA|nr:hypothetical protein PAAG_05492 [Paracoccidioides lutzii Pb01]EEH34444.2 hypothetical protein PAAG_05492 [Paracoccidioides lutzii Pb01]
MTPAGFLSFARVEVVVSIKGATCLTKIVASKKNIRALRAQQAHLRSHHCKQQFQLSIDNDTLSAGTCCGTRDSRGRLDQVPRLLTNFCHDLSARAFLARLTVNLDRHRTTRLIWMIERMKNTTRNLSVKIEKHHPLEATPSVKGESQMQPQPGSCPTAPAQPVPEPEPEPKAVNASEPAQPEPEPKAVTASERGLDCAGSDKENVEPSRPRRSISAALPDNISEDGPSKETHATVGDSFTHHLEPDTSSPHILLHREAREGHLEFLLWAPIWRSEDDIAKVHPDQLKRYKERLDVGPARRASQARKRARSPFPEPRRSSRQKKSRQC